MYVGEGQRKDEKALDEIVSSDVDDEGMLSDELRKSKTMFDAKRARKDDCDAMHVGEEQRKDEKSLDKNESSDVDDEGILSDELRKSKTMFDAKRARKDDCDAMHVGEEQCKDENSLYENDVDEERSLADEEMISEEDDESLDSEDDHQSIDGYEELEFRQLLKRRIEQDDPSLVHIEIDKYSVFPHEWGWGAFGESIGRNTHLKSITLYLHPRRVGLQFYQGFATNRSIENMILGGCCRQDKGMLHALAPFFQNNQTLECLCAEFRHWGDASLRTLASTLGQFDSLKEFTLKCSFDDWRSDRDEANRVFEALAGHTGLRRIDIIGIVLDRQGCVALSALLQDPRSNLIGMKLQRSTIDDEGATIISSGLKLNNTITELDIGQNTNMTEVGWQAFFDVLTSPTCKLKKLDLRNNDSFNDTVMTSLMIALRNNSSLKSLFLYEIGADWSDQLSRLLQSPNCTLECLDITETFPHINALISNSRLKELTLTIHNDCNATGWETIATVLRSPESALEKLNLRWSNINDNVIASVADALGVNSRLKELDLRGLRHVTATGWETFSTVLQNPTSALEKLNLGDNHINNRVIASFTGALVVNGRLRELRLSSNSDVTTKGWRTLSNFLQSPTSALEILDLGGNAMDDGVLSYYAAALSMNKTLKELILGKRGDRVTEYGYSFFVQMLCTQFIRSTFDSNHTLQKLDHGHRQGPKPRMLMSLLKINRESSKIQAARKKIIMTHFSGININLQPLTEIDPSVRHIAIAWMAKGEYSDSSELSLVYRFIRAVPAVLDK